MPRPQTKRALLDAIDGEYRTFLDLIDSVPRKRHREAGVWGDDWSINDLVAHLHAWLGLLLEWRDTGRRGTPEMPAPGYRWNETPRLNRDLQRRFARHGVTRNREQLEDSHRRVRRWVARLSDEDLFVAGRFAWTGKHALVKLVAPNTCNHYRTASGFVRRWLRGQGASG